MALPAAATYDKMDRPYNASMQRSVFSDAVTNVPGTTQEEGGRTIKTGEALTDVWIDTWIKSRTYQPKSQGFMLDSKGGYIECMDFSVGTGIDFYGNDGYFYDYTEASGGTYVKTATSSLNFMRKYYDDQNFIMQKRVGVNSPSADHSDNVFEMFYENASQGSRKNYIFIGGRGNTNSASEEHTDIVRIHANSLFQINSNVQYNNAVDFNIAAGGGDNSWSQDSTKIQIASKDTTATKYFTPPALSIDGLWDSGGVMLGVYDTRFGADPRKCFNMLLLLDHVSVWLGGDMLPMSGDLTTSIGSSIYRFLNIYSQTITVSTLDATEVNATHFIKSPVHYFDNVHYIQYASGQTQVNSTLTSSGDIISMGNMQSLGGVIRVGSTNFVPRTITYKNGGGTNSTGTFLMA